MILGGKIIMPPKSHLLVLLEKLVTTKITYTCFTSTWKTSRCDFGGGKIKWWEHFPMHEIRRINGRRGFQTGGNVFQISGNKFYDQKHEIPMKILELKRSVIRIIVELRRIPTGFPNQGTLDRSLSSIPSIWLGNEQLRYCNGNFSWPTLWHS